MLEVCAEKQNLILQTLPPPLVKVSPDIAPPPPSDYHTNFRQPKCTHCMFDFQAIGILIDSPPNHSPTHRLGQDLSQATLVWAYIIIYHL